VSCQKASFLQTPEGLSYAPGYPPPKEEKAFCQYAPPIEPSFKPREKRLLITVAVGKSLEVLRVTRPAMEAYAAEVGADFIALTNRTQTWPLAEKFRVGHFAAAYERALFVDADVFIRPGAPDIFEHVPAGSIAMHDDFPAGVPDWLKRENEALGKSQGAKLADGRWNTGVVVFDGKDSDIWDAPPKAFPVAHCQEQNFINGAASERGVMSLDVRWNWQWWHHPTFEHIEEACFVHVSGLHGKREFLLPLLRALALR
jgi:hypothetical protein